MSQKTPVPKALPASLAALVATDVPGGVRFGIRVMPRSPRTSVGGVRDGRLIVRVTAPPVDGAANAAVIEALADALEVSRRSVRIVSGETGRNKTVEVQGVRAAESRAPRARAVRPAPGAR